MNDEENQSRETITAYIGLQNEPLGDEPNISISFGISLRVFCIAFALSKIEKDRQMKDIDLNDEDDDPNTIKLKLEKDECSDDCQETNLEYDNIKEDETDNDNNQDKKELG